MAEVFSVYMAGVGGQGIGLLSELLARAAMHAGLEVHGCDTHGLAQRGGMVSSHLRLGPAASPLVSPGCADLVLALERTEALRAAQQMLRNGGALVWYDTAWQALDVRSGQHRPVSSEDVLAAVGSRQGRAWPLYRESLGDVRMQNMVVVAWVVQNNLIPGLDRPSVEAALRELVPAATAEANLAVLDVFRA